MYAYMCLCVCVCTHESVDVYVCMYVCMCLCIRMHVCACTCVYLCTCVYVLCAYEFRPEANRWCCSSGPVYLFKELLFFMWQSTHVPQYGCGAQRTTAGVSFAFLACGHPG